LSAIKWQKFCVTYSWIWQSKRIWPKTAQSKFSRESPIGDSQQTDLAFDKRHNRSYWPHRSNSLRAAIVGKVRIGLLDLGVLGLSM
jgi:hypothetical protein